MKTKLFLLRNCVTALVLLALPAVVQAQFTLTTNDDSITITGYTGPGGAVVIPAETNGYAVTDIEGFAFAYITSLTSITIPGSVTNIGGFAFTYCTNLTSAYFEGNAPSDDGTNFYGDPDAVVYYEAGTTGWGPTFGGAPTEEETPPSDFQYVWNGSNGYIITGYIFPNDVVTIPPYINGYPVTSIQGDAGNGVFRPNVTSVTIPTTVTSIGDWAFAVDMALPSVTIPGSVTSIGEEAFENCRNLRSVIISNGVTSIGEYAFNFCTSLTSVTIPGSVTNIGHDAFSGCSSLTSAYFEGNAPPDDGTAFASDPDAVVYYEAGTTGWGPTFGGAPTEEETPASDFSYEYFYDSITIMGYHGPSGAVVIPPYINGYTVTGISTTGPISGFPNATSVTIPSTVTSIGEFAFMQCQSLTNVIIGDGDTTIGYEAFYFCDALTSVTIPNSVTNIGGGAFQWCARLASVTIPGGVTIGGAAFEDCDSLTSVAIPGSVTAIGVSAFSSCASLTNISVAAANPAYVSTNGILFDKAYDTLVQYPAGLTSNVYTIPNSVTNIGVDAFEGCANLTSVTIPGGVTTIGTGSFYNCDNLTSVTIPGSVTYIGPVAFSSCNRLTNIVIPDGVTSIGDNTFAYCSSLSSISIPNSVTSIGEYAFYECTNLTSITIPASVTSIGLVAFEYCYDLESAYFEGNAPGDNGTAFYDDPVTVYYLPGTTGWGPTFGSAPTELWNPQATAFTAAGGQFGFSITGPTNATIVVETCTNLANPVWLPVSTNTLSGGTSSFSDPQSMNYPNRYYRFSAP